MHRFSIRPAIIGIGLFCTSVPLLAQPNQVSSLPQLLRLYGLDESELDPLIDGVDIGPSEERLLARILFRLGRVEQLDWHRFAQRNIVDSLKSPEHPSGNRPNVEVEDQVGPESQIMPERLRAFHLAGRAIEVRRYPLAADLAERFEISHYYRVAILPADSASSPVGRILLYTQQVPSAWPIDVRMDEPVRAKGAFLKLGLVAEGRADYVLASPRIEWFPDRSTTEVAIGSDQLQLAAWGMDIALFDDVRGRNRMSLGSEEKECFYRLMAATSNRGESAFARRKLRPVDFATMLREPQLCHGGLYSVDGVVRRVSRVLVSETDIQERYGIDHYFQLDLFVPLGNQVIRLGKSDTGASPTFEHSFPVTVCLRHLPAGLPEGDELREKISVKASFFKLWTYRSQFVSSFNPRQLQLSPMMIGFSARIASPPSSTDSQVIGAVVGILLLGVLGGAWLVVWRFRQSDRQFAAQLQRRKANSQLPLPDKDYADQPDFFSLDRHNQQDGPG